jgi:tol-pal system beta propeller repeat protein TolB
MHRDRHHLAWLALPFALALPIIACGQATIDTTDSPAAQDSNPAPAATPAGGGGKIAFATGRDGAYEIYSVAPDGSGATRLTNTEPTGKYFPKWAPVGDVLLYWTYAADPAVSDEYWLKSDGTTGLFANTVQPYVSFSPDGQTVVMCSTGKNGSLEILTVPLKGGDPTWLTDNAAKDYMPAWSPDGKTIAFVSDRDGVQYIYLMDADGGNPRRLTTNEYPELSPAWSPDGSRLAFFSGNNDVTNIFVVEADGTGSMNITKQDSGFNEDPTWSPDGTLLAFWSSRSGDNEIYRMGADGGGVTNLTNSPGPDENPSWSK